MIVPLLLSWMKTRRRSSSRYNKVNIKGAVQQSAMTDLSDSPVLVSALLITRDPKDAELTLIKEANRQHTRAETAVDIKILLIGKLECPLVELRKESLMRCN